MRHTRRTVCLVGWLAFTVSCPAFWAAVSLATSPVCEIGVARVDITPDHPIRMAGYSSRLTESEGVEQRLWAKALAIGRDQAASALLIAVDNCGVPASMAEEIAGRLEKKAGIERRRIVVCSTHIHTGPCLQNLLPMMFGRPIPEAHKRKIGRYTLQLTDRLEQVALAALADRRPARLAWSQGKVTFAVNRRVIRDGRGVGLGVKRDGAVDHALPVLRVTGAGGKLRALVVNYACHCTTLGGSFNQICGDWAGYAAEYIERDHPGTLCLVTIGCGADADPQPRRQLDDAKQHGREIATEVGRLLKQNLKPIHGPLACRRERIRLPFDKIPTRDQWESRAGRDDPVGYHARVQLARLDRGEALQTELVYPVQTWAFGEDLAMVFLAGEVVVDYALRFKKEFDADRLWVTAYANDVPCYIPSRRILAEGGYEAEGAMVYYDRPGRLVPEVEDLIAAAVHRLLPKEFRSDESLTPGPK